MLCNGYSRYEPPLRETSSGQGNSNEGDVDLEEFPEARNHDRDGVIGVSKYRHQYVCLLRTH